MNSVYALIDPRDTQARYIGVSSNPRVRFSQHCTTEKPSKVSRWISELRSAGTRPEMLILEECASNMESRKCEAFWVDYFRFLGAELTNMRKGGGGYVIFDQTSEGGANGYKVNLDIASRGAVKVSK